MQNTTTPQENLVSSVVIGLDESLREEFEERAATVEFDVKLTTEALSSTSLSLPQILGLVPRLSSLKKKRSTPVCWLCVDPGLPRQ